MAAFRHTASHIMAQAVKRLYPETKLAIGPSMARMVSTMMWTDETPLTGEDLEKIEAEMKKIIKEGSADLSVSQSPREEAIAVHEGKRRAVQSRTDRGSSGGCRTSAFTARVSS